VRNQSRPTQSSSKKKLGVREEDSKVKPSKRETEWKASLSTTKRKQGLGKGESYCHAKDIILKRGKKEEAKASIHQGRGSTPR